jgi:hypothetical protein
MLVISVLTFLSSFVGLPWLVAAVHGHPRRGMTSRGGFWGAPDGATDALHEAVIGGVDWKT